MKIFEKDGWIFIQLMDMTTKKMLMDFSVGKEFFNELRDHIIENLENFRLEEEPHIEFYEGSIEKKMEEDDKKRNNSKPSDVEEYLGNLAGKLEPKTHCCECTPGEHFERHGIHIQYPDCKCDPEKFVLKGN